MHLFIENIGSGEGIRILEPWQARALLPGPAKSVLEGKSYRKAA
jgi:hypothetical protein